MAGKREALMKKFLKNKENPKWDESTKKAFDNVRTVNRILDKYKIDTEKARPIAKKLRIAVNNLNYWLDKYKSDVATTLTNAKDEAVRELNSIVGKISEEDSKNLFYTASNINSDTKVGKLEELCGGRSGSAWRGGKGRFAYLKYFIEKFEQTKKQWETQEKKRKKEAKQKKAADKASKKGK